MTNYQGRTTTFIISCLVVYACLLLSFGGKTVCSWSYDSTTRRHFTNGMVAGSSLLTPFVNNIPEANAVSLAERLSQRDPSALTNSVFNIPPPAQVYPDFMRGSWNITLQYAGYTFPSSKIPRSRLTTNAQIPGFQKCSIAALSDVGKEMVQYAMQIDESTGLENREISLTTSINDHLGYEAVQEVLYNRKANPNRLSIVFVGYRTTNAERVELFCNERESELIKPIQQQTNVDGDGDSNTNVIQKNDNNIFVCSEYIRQVTFSGGSQVGIPRQVGTNYAHFWTWKENNNKRTITGNLLTACYLDPQDAMFFEEPSKPVAVFSHVIKAEKI